MIIDEVYMFVENAYNVGAHDSHLLLSIIMLSGITGIQPTS